MKVEHGIQDILRRMQKMKIWTNRKVCPLIYLLLLACSACSRMPHGPQSCGELPDKIVSATQYTNELPKKLNRTFMSLFWLIRNDLYYDKVVIIDSDAPLRWHMINRMSLHGYCTSSAPKNQAEARVMTENVLQRVITLMGSRKFRKRLDEYPVASKYIEINISYVQEKNKKRTVICRSELLQNEFTFNTSVKGINFDPWVFANFNLTLPNYEN